jgi:hypothetical protein
MRQALANCHQILASASGKQGSSKRIEGSVELEVFHNPFAAIPFPIEMLPAATHWFELDGEYGMRRIS